jgi:RsmE family RNA methyltransferase
VNLILLEPEDFASATRVRLSGRRLAHVRDVHRARPGDTLRVGRLDGELGTGRVLSLDDGALELEVSLDTAPPAPSPVRLLLALPRPPSLRKVLQQATALGVKEFWLVHSRRVEKSFWHSHGLEPDALRRQLLLGLEQAGDTIVPRVELRRSFRPFVEDELPALLSGSRGLVAHPESPTPCPRALAEPVTLVVGPEGGFLSHEIDLLAAQGVEPVGLGERVLRVETAVVALLARLAP